MNHDLKGLPLTPFEITPVLAGWSADEKYRVVTKNGRIGGPHEPRD